MAGWERDFTVECSAVEMLLWMSGGDISIQIRPCNFAAKEEEFQEMMAIVLKDTVGNFLGVVQPWILFFF
jgi:hypothetical protein